MKTEKTRDSLIVTAMSKSLSEILPAFIRAIGEIRGSVFFIAVVYSEN
jgi:hypothetical protein